MDMNAITELNGPNRVLPSTKICTSSIDECVALKLPKHGMAIETTPPISIPNLLRRTVLRYPKRTALAWKDERGEWKTFNYKDYENEVKICAKAFLSLGLEPNHSVCILGFNSPEWFISALGAIYAGGIVAGIYTTNSAATCLHCAERAKANIIVVQDAKQLKKIQSIKNQLPLLKAIIQYEGVPESSDILSWEQLRNIGLNENDVKLDAALEGILINKCCSLVFTSGTVGKPKAVMLNHDNLTWGALAVSEGFRIDRNGERIISYLPLSHIAAQSIDIFLCITIGGTAYFADKDAFKGSLIKTMQEVRPTYFIGVPRIWEKIYEKMCQISSQNGYLTTMIAGWAKSQALKYNLNKMNGYELPSWSYKIAQLLIFKRIKQALGLDQCKYHITAAAPLSSEIKKYFLSIDIPLMEVFGMSETSGGHTLSLHHAFNLDSIGLTIPGMKTKIFQADENNVGEVCLYGRQICMGYLDEPEKTQETLDNDGWLHSGDLGYINEKGFIFMTGRIKELLITAGGENIPPVYIEQTVKAELPYISNALLIGDKRKFLSILLTLKCNTDSEGYPLSDLTHEVKEWLVTLGCPAETVEDVLKAGPDNRLLSAIQDGIDKANEKAISRAQHIQKFAILPSDFSIFTGEFGPTMKVKRNVVIAKYEDIIEKFYS